MGFRSSSLNGKSISNLDNSITKANKSSDSQEIKYIEYDISGNDNDKSDNGTRFGVVEYLTPINTIPTEVDQSLAEMQDNKNLESNSQSSDPEKSKRRSTDSKNGRSNEPENNNLHDYVQEKEVKSVELSNQINEAQHTSSTTSIMKEPHVVTSTTIPTDYIKPTPIDYQRFVGVKNSMYLKVPNMHETSDEDLDNDNIQTNLHELLARTAHIRKNNDVELEKIVKEAGKANHTNEKRNNDSHKKNNEHLKGNATGKITNGATTGEHLPSTKKEGNHKQNGERKLNTSTPELSQDFNTKRVLSDKKLNGSMMDTSKNGNKKSTDRKGDLPPKKSPSSSKNGVEKNTIINYSSIPAATTIYSPRGVAVKKKTKKKKICAKYSDCRILDICEPKVPQDEFVNNIQCDGLHDATPLECHKQFPIKGICSSSTRNIRSVDSDENQREKMQNDSPAEIYNGCCTVLEGELLNRGSVNNRTPNHSVKKGTAHGVQHPGKRNICNHSPEPARRNLPKKCCFAEPEVDTPCACPDDGHDEVPPTSFASASSGSGSKSDTAISRASEENCSCKSDIEVLRGLKEASKEPSANSEKIMSCTACTASPQQLYPEFISEVSRVARAHGVFGPTPMSTSGTDADTDQSHLHTISERTEATSEDATQITDEIPLDKPKQLTVQHLPQINIRPSLTMQKVFEIEIKPTGSVQMQLPSVPNVSYEEIMHSEDAPQQSLYDLLTKKFSTNNSNNTNLGSIGSEDVDIPKMAESKDFTVIRKTSVSFRTAENCSSEQEEEDTLNEDRKPCLKEQETLPMNKLKSNVSFKQIPEAKVISSPEILTKVSSIILEDTSSEVEVLDKPKEDADVDGEHNAIIDNVLSDDIKEIKDTSYDHGNSSLMIVESPAAENPSTVHTDESKTLSDYSEPMELHEQEHEKPNDNVLVHEVESEINDLLAQTYEACGCFTDRHVIHNKGGFVVDTALDSVCKCEEVHKLELMPTDDTKTSLEQILQAEATLTLLTSTSVVHIAPSAEVPKTENKAENWVGEDHQEEDQQIKDDQLILDEISANEQIIEEVANVNQSPNEEEKLTASLDVFELEGGAAADHELPNTQTLSSNKEQSNVTPENNIEEEETPPPTEEESNKNPENDVQEELDPPNENTEPAEIEEEVNNAKNDNSENDNSKNENSKNDNSQNQDNTEAENMKPENSSIEKGTPLFTVDPNRPSDSDVPKSVSQYFSDSNITEVEVEANKDVDDRTLRLSILSNSNRKCNFDDVLNGALGEVDKEIQRLNERSQIRSDLIDCDCICKKETHGLIPLIKLPSSKQQLSSPDKVSATSKLSGSSKTSSQKVAKKRPSNDKFERRVSINSQMKLVKLPSEENKTSATILKVGAPKESIESELILPTIHHPLQPTPEQYNKRPNIRRSYVENTHSDKVCKKTSFVFDNENEPQSDLHNVSSADSIYVVMHDISTQVSMESIQSERSAGSSRIDRKLPRVKISVVQEAKNVKKYKVKSKDQYQQSHVAPQDSTENVKESIEPVVLQPLIVRYETSGIQQSLEQRTFPSVKLHKLCTCDDVGTITANDTDIENYPVRNAPFGDTPITSEFIPFNVSRFSTLQAVEDEPIPLTPRHNYSSSSGATETRLEDSLSEGEIKCKCSVSIGELHICRIASDIKTKTAYLKKHPEALLKREYPGEEVHLQKQNAFYDNWVTFYTTKRIPATTSSSDTGEMSTDT